MKKLLVVVLVLIALVVIAGQVMSPEVKLSRSVVIKAPTAKVHEYVGDLKNWPAWEPWTDKEAGGDPDIKTTLSPTTTGVGAHQTWTGKDGDGELTFTKSDPNSGIAYDMVLIKGDMRVPSKGVITYKAVEGGTEVTWSMDGNFDMSCLGGLIKWGRIMAPMMKGEIGKMFDFGLAKLKKISEAGGA